MGWFSTFIGGVIGFQLGGVIGAVAGAAIGNMVGSRTLRTARGASRSRFSTTERTQATYFVTFFTLLGKFAQVDGSISRDEEQALYGFLDELHLPPDQRSFAVQLFQEGKRSQYSIEVLAGEFMRVAPDRLEIRLTLFDMLYRLAVADRSFHPEEERFLGIIARIFHISAAHQEYIRRKYLGETKQHYSILGVEPEASDEELRKAYRAKVKEFHPDRIVSRGMPEEFIVYAKKQFREVQDAWDAVKAERGIS